MNPFNASYARYYDAFYQSKAYGEEADYVHQLLQAHVPGCRSLLELGCGTGKHALWFLDHGYEYSGIDLSPWMLERAKALLGNQASLQLGDVRGFRGPDKVQAVISLFHVVSYQTVNEDLIQMLETASHHLSPGGVFLFDYWYGPAVLSERPVGRVKRVPSDGGQIIRVAEPVHHVSRNVVDVNYTILLPEGKTWSVIEEMHPMRYWFEPELEWFLNQVGFEKVGSHAWLTKAAPDLSSWNAVYVARKR